MLTGGTLSLTWVILSSSDMTKDIHQPLCFQQFSMATPQKHYLKRGEKPPQNPIMKFFLFQAHPRESKKHQLPQWLMSSGGGGTGPPSPSSFHQREQCTHTWKPLSCHRKKWLREAQLFSLRKFNLQSIWPRSQFQRCPGVREPCDHCYKPRDACSR